MYDKLGSFPGKENVSSKKEKRTKHKFSEEQSQGEVIMNTSEHLSLGLLPGLVFYSVSESGGEWG